MPTKFKQLILSYCAANEVHVPPGFGRNTPGRFAIVRLDATPPKLVATTWSKVADVIYYIENLLGGEPGGLASTSIRILDFKELAELSYSGGKSLAHVSSITMPAGAT